MSGFGRRLKILETRSIALDATNAERQARIQCDANEFVARINTVSPRCAKLFNEIGPMDPASAYERMKEILNQVASEISQRARHEIV